MKRVLLVLCLVALNMGSVSLAAAQQKSTDEVQDLTAKIARFSPTVITADVSKLSANDRKALDKIIAASRLLDPLFLSQLWSGNLALQKKLEADKSELGKLRLHYFNINKGPWSQLDDNKAFLDGVPAEKPQGAAHYPDDMAKEEFTKWVDTRAPTEKAKATGFFQPIRGGRAGK